MLKLYQRMNVDLPSDLHSIAVNIESAFDLAWALGILHVLHSDPTVIAQPLSTLCQLQLSDGAWPGAGNLRVTDPDCFQPWQAPAGEYYTDQRPYHYHGIRIDGALDNRIRWHRSQSQQHLIKAN